MEDLQACRVCLATSVKLYDMYKYNLKYLFEIISGTQVSPTDTYPQYLCSYCGSLLLKCGAFRQRCHRALEIMKNAEMKIGLLNTSQIHSIAVWQNTALPLSISSLETSYPSVELENTEHVADGQFFEEEVDFSDEEPLANKIKKKHPAIEVQVPPLENEVASASELTDGDEEQGDSDDSVSTEAASDDADLPSNEIELNTSQIRSIAVWQNTALPHSISALETSYPSVELENTEHVADEQFFEQQVDFSGVEPLANKLNTSQIRSTAVWQNTALPVSISSLQTSYPSVELENTEHVTDEQFFEQQVDFSDVDPLANKLNTSQIRSTAVWQNTAVPVSLSSLETSYPSVELENTEHVTDEQFFEQQVDFSVVDPLANKLNTSQIRSTAVWQNTALPVSISSLQTSYPSVELENTEHVTNEQFFEEEVNFSNVEPLGNKINMKYPAMEVQVPPLENEVASASELTDCDDGQGGPDFSVLMEAASDAVDLPSNEIELNTSQIRSIAVWQNTPLPVSISALETSYPSVELENTEHVTNAQFFEQQVDFSDVDPLANKIKTTYPAMDVQVPPLENEVASTSELTDGDDEQGDSDDSVSTEAASDDADQPSNEIEVKIKYPAIEVQVPPLENEVASASELTDCDDEQREPDFSVSTEAASDDVDQPSNKIEVKIKYPAIEVQVPPLENEVASASELTECDDQQREPDFSVLTEAASDDVDQPSNKIEIKMKYPAMDVQVPPLENEVASTSELTDGDDEQGDSDDSVSTEAASDDADFPSNEIEIKKKDPAIEVQVPPLENEVASASELTDCDDEQEDPDFSVSTEAASDDVDLPSNEIEVISLTVEEQLKEVLDRKNSFNYMNSFYKCELCYKGFIQDATYKNHMRRHDPAHGDETCPICQTRWPNIRSLKSHTAAAHERNYICKLCTHVTKSSHRAKEHLQWHKGHKFVCKVCGATFSKSTSHLTHLRLHHPSKYCCEVCGESFVGEMGLSLHVKKAHRGTEQIKPQFKCGVCELYFKSMDALVRHCNGYENGICVGSQCSCFQCGENVPTQDDLREHLKTHDAGVKCDECNRTFAHERSFSIHYQRVHLGIKLRPRVKSKRVPWVCEICGTTCFSNAALVYHQRIHTGEKPYQCIECPKKFSTFQRLQIHVRTHTGERPFKCPSCPKAFKHKAALNRHERVHSGEKPYQCTLCGKTFSQSNSMKLHVRTVHLKLPAPYRSRAAHGFHDFPDFHEFLVFNSEGT